MTNQTTPQQPLSEGDLREALLELKQKAQRRFHDNHDDGDLAIAEFYRRSYDLFKEQAALREKPADNYMCCDELEKALGDHRGLHSQTIGSITSDELDVVIMYAGGEYKLRNRIVVQYCPFCGKPRRRASEYEAERKQ
jgi:hypothetical protein